MIECYSYAGRRMNDIPRPRVAKRLVKSGEYRWIVPDVSVQECRKSVEEFLGAIGYDTALIKGHWHGQQPNFSNGGEIADPRTPIEEQRRCYHARLTAQLVLS